MQVIVYRFGQRSADSVHFDQVVNPGPDNSLQTTKLAQQFAALFGTQAGNLFEPRCVAGFCPPLPVPGDRESMRLIPYLLNQK
jgi:hypothetical protein